MLSLFQIQGYTLSYLVKLCAPKSLKIQCPANKVLRIEKADFGRVSDRFTCSTSGVINSVNRKRRSIFRYCSKDVAREVTKQCGGRNSCWLVADLKHFQTPCIRYPGGEYLLFDYRCVEGMLIFRSDKVKYN